MRGHVGGHLDVAALRAPAVRRAQVGQLCLAPSRPDRASRGRSTGSSDGRLVGEVRRVPVAGALEPAGLGEPLLGEHAGSCRRGCSGSAPCRGRPRPATCGRASRGAGAPRCHRPPRRPRRAPPGRSHRRRPRPCAGRRVRPRPGGRRTRRPRAGASTGDRARARAPSAAASGRSSRSRTSVALIAAIRAAASSMPRGRPSSVWQISITAAAVCSSWMAYSGRTAPARSNEQGDRLRGHSRLHAQGRHRHDRLPRCAQQLPGRGQDPGGVGPGEDLADRPPRPRPGRAHSCRRRAAAAVPRPPPRRCRSPGRHLGRDPQRRRDASATASPSATAASSTSHTPSGKSSASSAATASASRVLPTPPAPVSVTRRQVRTAAAAAWTASVRPTRE